MFIFCFFIYFHFNFVDIFWVFMFFLFFKKFFLFIFVFLFFKKYVWLLSLFACCLLFFVLFLFSRWVLFVCFFGQIFFCSMFFVVQGLFGKAFGSKFFSHETFLLFSEGEFVLKHVKNTIIVFHVFYILHAFPDCIVHFFSHLCIPYLFAKKSGLPLIFYSIIFFVNY